MAFIFVWKFKKINKNFFRFLKTFGCLFSFQIEIYWTEIPYLSLGWTQDHGQPARLAPTTTTTSTTTTTTMYKWDWHHIAESIQEIWFTLLDGLVSWCLLLLVIVCPTKRPPKQTSADHAISQGKQNFMFK